MHSIIYQDITSYKTLNVIILYNGPCLFLWWCSISKKFDPSLSETYKALQEEQIGDHVQEVTVPVQPKVFTPNKVIPGKVKYVNTHQSSSQYNLKKSFIN